MNSTRTKRTRATFTVPEETFRRFASYVPERQRSQVVADLMAQEIARREAELIAACEAANADSGIAEVEAEFQAFATSIEEPWEDE